MVASPRKIASVSEPALAGQDEEDQRRRGGAQAEVLNLGGDLEGRAPIDRSTSTTGPMTPPGRGGAGGGGRGRAGGDRDRGLVEPDALIGLVGIQVVRDVVGILGHRQAEICVVGDRRAARPRAA